MIRLSMKQTVVLVVVIAALLVALVAGIIRVDTARGALPGYTGAHVVSQLAWYCPAPPMGC
jgi:hypothetical protein